MRHRKRKAQKGGGGDSNQIKSNNEACRHKEKLSNLHTPQQRQGAFFINSNIPPPYTTLLNESFDYLEMVGCEMGPYSMIV